MSDDYGDREWERWAVACGLAALGLVLVIAALVCSGVLDGAR